MLEDIFEGIHFVVEKLNDRILRSQLAIDCIVHLLGALIDFLSLEKLSLKNLVLRWYLSALLAQLLIRELDWGQLLHLLAHLYFESAHVCLERPQILKFLSLSFCWIELVVLKKQLFF